MIDLFSRQVVGWQMSHRIDQELVNDALQAALMTRGKPKGVMVHTDQGSQYCANSFVALTKANHCIQSMSRRPLNRRNLASMLEKHVMSQALALF